MPVQLRVQLLVVLDLWTASLVCIIMGFKTKVRSFNLAEEMMPTYHQTNLGSTR